jgi:hypothetical protein
LPAYTQAISGEPHWRYCEDVYDETIESDGATLLALGSPILTDLVGRFLRGAFGFTSSSAHRDVFPQGASPR